MSDLNDLAENIIRELIRLQSAPQIGLKTDDPLRMTGTIHAGDERVLHVSREIELDIKRFARRLMEDDLPRKTRFTQGEWHRMVRRAFGPPLASIDLDDDVSDNATTVIRQVKDTLRAGTEAIQPREFAFGCTLFRDAEVRPFTIGPVCFEQLENWLVRKSEDGAISKTSRRRIERIRSGEKLKKRKPSWDSSDEDTILGMLGEVPFVCSVKTVGLAPDAGREKALMAARLAITAIALAWSSPARALNGFCLNYDIALRKQDYVHFTPEQQLLFGSKLSHHPFGEFLSPGSWVKMFSDWADVYGIVGDALDYLLSPTGKVARPKLMSTLVHALIWFHAACREPMAHMAITKFASSLDALARGGKARGICDLLEARWNVPRERTIDLPLNFHPAAT